MPRPARLIPWIENLIQSYGGKEEVVARGGGRLKAHVIGVGQKSQSQTQSSEDPSGLLYLSDGALQIPAVLTAAAWERLQEREDRECFYSLLNATVSILDCRLLFHSAPEQTRCRFFLSVGEMVTLSVGPVKDGTPCCTTLPSVQMKICRIWRELQVQEELDSQKSQCCFDLSELLGEWQLDCLQEVLDDVRDRLMAAARSRLINPQPSTSACNPPPLLRLHTFTATSWDVDRVKYKDVDCFSVPVAQLLIPEDAASQDRNTHLPNVCEHPENTATPSVNDADWRINEPAGVEKERHKKKEEEEEDSPLPEDGMLLEDVIAEMNDSTVRPLQNPWDIFPLPGGSSSSDMSPEVAPAWFPNAKSTPERPGTPLTGEQLPLHSGGVHSFFPPYQKPPPSSRLPTTASPPAALTGPQTPDIPDLDQQEQIQDVQEEGIQAAKRKRSKSPEEHEAQVSGSPPSWLFDSPEVDGGDSGDGGVQGEAVASTLRTIPSTHSDGSCFSYSYQTSQQNQKDFSHVKISNSLLHWAVKYLLDPKTQ